MSSLPILYSFRRCPYAMRARLAIASSQQRCELREVTLRDKPPSMLQASPKGTVPVLVDNDGHVIDESLDIMLWALNKNDPQAWLVPQQDSLAGMLALIADCDQSFKFHLDRYKYPQRYAVDALEHRTQGAKFLAALNARLNQYRFLFGDHESLADMAIAPFVRQFAHTDTAWFDTQPWPQLQKWLSAWQVSALFESIMHKYVPWRAEQPIIYFPLML